MWIIISFGLLLSLLGFDSLLNRGDTGRTRLYAALLLQQLDDLRTDDALVDLQVTGQLLRQLGAGVESDVDVVTLGLVVDGIGQAALAPLLNLDNLTAVGSDDTVELLDELLAGGLLDSGIDDVDQFVLIHDPFTSFWTLVPPFLRWNKDVPVTYISTGSLKNQGPFNIFFKYFDICFDITFLPKCLTKRGYHGIILRILF